MTAANRQDAELTGPEPGGTQGEAAASRSCQGSLDGNAPTPGPANSSAANPQDAATQDLIERLYLLSSTAIDPQVREIAVEAATVIESLRDALCREVAT